MTSKRRKLTSPAHTMIEREFSVTYTVTSCQCENCRRTKKVRAFDRQDARKTFQKQAPLATVILVD